MDLEKSHKQYEKLMGYTVVNIGINPENPVDVRLFLAKQHDNDGEKSYSYLEVAPCTNDTEEESGRLKIEPAQIRSDENEG